MMLVSYPILQVALGASPYIVLESLILNEVSQAKLDMIKNHFGFKDDMVNHITSADPTRGNYAYWIANHIHKGNLRFPEDKERINTQLKTFHSLKNSPTLR